MWFDLVVFHAFEIIATKKQQKLMMCYCGLCSSQQRILLINTPLHNTLKELWTMIHFLLPGITRPYTDFPVKPGTDQNQDYCHKLVIRLHRVSVGLQPNPSSS